MYTIKCARVCIDYAYPVRDNPFRCINTRRAAARPIKRKSIIILYAHSVIMRTYLCKYICAPADVSIWSHSHRAHCTATAKSFYPVQGLSAAVAAHANIIIIYSSVVCDQKRPVKKKKKTVFLCKSCTASKITNRTNAFVRSRICVHYQINVM